MAQRRWLLPTIVAVVAVVLAVIYYHFDPSQGGGWFPQCGMYRLTGLRCPGCGLQRAAHALLHGDVVGALRYNAMLPVIGVGLALYAVIIWRDKRDSLSWRVANHPATSIVALVLMLGWMIVRNILGC